MLNRPTRPRTARPARLVAAMYGDWSMRSSCGEMRSGTLCSHPAHDIAEHTGEYMSRFSVLHGRALATAGNEQVVERRIELEEHILPRGKRGLPALVIRLRHLIVASA